MTKLVVIPPFTLEVTFNDGRTRRIDMEPELRGRHGVFESLKDPEYFAQAFIDPVSRTVAWPNEVDLAPEWLYEPDPEKYWGKALLEEYEASTKKKSAVKSKRGHDARI